MPQPGGVDLPCRPPPRRRSASPDDVSGQPAGRPRAAPSRATGDSAGRTHVPPTARGYGGRHLRADVAVRSALPARAVTLVQAAHEVVGVGSVGTRAWI